MVVAVSRMGQRGNKIRSDSSSSHGTKGWKGAHPASTQCRTPPYKVTDKRALYPGVMATRSSLRTQQHLLQGIISQTELWFRWRTAWLWKGWGLDFNPSPHKRVTWTDLASSSSLIFLICITVITSCFPWAFVLKIQWRPTGKVWMNFILGSFFFFFFSLFGHVAHGVLVPWLGIESVPPALSMWSFNNWTTGEIPVNSYCPSFSLFHLPFLRAPSLLLFSLIFPTVCVCFLLYYHRSQ